MTEIIELPLKFFCNSKDFRYDDVKHRIEDAEADANEHLALYKKIIPELHKDSLYIKLTAGQRAGTIARLADYSFDAYFRYYAWAKGATASRTARTKVHHEPDSYVSGGRGSLGSVTRTAGKLFVDNVPIWSRDYNNGWDSGEPIQIIVDGHRTISKFSLFSAFMDSARPVFLLGYDGPAVWCYSKKVDESKPSITMTDRFGAEIGKGDLVIMAARSCGTLMVGKIERISPKKSVWLKHIGAKLPHMETSVISHQFIKVKDIEQTLMMQKLSTL
jgi:hypothetical protein